MEYLILGAGVSGKSLATYLKKTGASFSFYDDKVNGNEEGFLTKEQALEFLTNKNCSLLLSPGVPSEHFLVKKAKEHQREVLGELEFSLRKIQTPVVAVTGTNGKSTVVSMIQHILKESGSKTILLGNIGTPVSSAIDEANSSEFVVLEISSYQLEHLTNHNFLLCVFLNFSEDHLERHKTLKKYFHAKWKIFSSTNGDSMFFCGQSVLDLAGSFDVDLKATKKPFHKLHTKHTEAFVPENLHIPHHNLRNAAYSLQVCSALLNKTPQTLGKHLENFQTIPHRFEKFASHGGLTFIDDSKATNMDATLSALKSLDKKTLLLLGGLSKGSSFKPILSYKEKISRVVSFGSSSDIIKRELGTSLSVTPCSTLGAACTEALSIVAQDRSFELVLLSPACSSFDEFQNFEDRGKFFQQKINELLKKEVLTHGGHKSK